MTDYAKAALLVIALTGLGYAIGKNESNKLEQSNIRVDVPSGQSIDRVVYDAEFVTAMSPDSPPPTVETPSPKDTVKVVVRNPDGTATTRIYRIRATTGRE